MRVRERIIELRDELAIATSNSLDGDERGAAAPVGGMTWTSTVTSLVPFLRMLVDSNATISTVGTGTQTYNTERKHSLPPIVEWRIKSLLHDENSSSSSDTRMYKSKNVRETTMGSSALQGDAIEDFDDDNAFNIS